MPGDVVRERIQNHPVNIRIVKCPENRQPPTRGILSGPRLSRQPAGGRGSKDLRPEGPPHLPHFPLQLFGEVGG